MCCAYDFWISFVISLLLLPVGNVKPENPLYNVWLPSYFCLPQIIAFLFHILFLLLLHNTLFYTEQKMIVWPTGYLSISVIHFERTLYNLQDLAAENRGQQKSFIHLYNRSEKGRTFFFLIYLFSNIAFVNLLQVLINFFFLFFCILSFMIITVFLIFFFLLSNMLFNVTAFLTFCLILLLLLFFLSQHSWSVPSWLLFYH